MSLADVGAAAFAFWFASTVFGFTRISRSSGAVFAGILALLVMLCAIPAVHVGQLSPELRSQIRSAVVLVLTVTTLLAIVRSYVAYRRQRAIVARYFNRPDTRKRRLDLAPPGAWADED